MSSRTNPLRPVKVLSCAGWCVCAFWIGSLTAFLAADEVSLKNGVVLSGTAVQVPGLNETTAARAARSNVFIMPYWLIDDGVRRFFVHRTQVVDVLQDDPLAQRVTYPLKHELQRRAPGPSTVGGFVGVPEPFDQFGRRLVQLRTDQGLVDIILGITELGPDSFQVTGLTHHWEFSLDTSTLSPEQIRAIMEQASDRTDPKERKASVLFFLQAGLHSEAQRELDSIAEGFPELEDWAKEYRAQITEAIARSGINEVQRRRQAGQHRLAYLIARKAPADEVSASVFREAREIVDDYDQALMQRDQVVLMLDMLQAQISLEDADRLRSMKAQLLDELRYENISRLNPFLRSETDETLTAEQKLALAYSGWVLGEANAVLNLDEAVLLWQARFHVLEFLRNRDNPLLDDEMIEALRGLEYFSLERIAQMIPLLPPPQPGELIPNGEVREIDADVELTAPQTRYTICLPPEYSPHREYPLLVVLRAAGGTEEGELRWWAGDATRPGWAQRRGYIVIAPHYTQPDATHFSGDPSAHQIVTAAICDVRQRYRVDSDRIFLAGHGMGGDACFDLGMTLTDWFAGIVPITGQCDTISKFSWQNAPEQAWYIVSGQRDRETLNKNATVIDRMMANRQNVIFCDYKERGYETYFEEQERIFEWMQLQRRPPLSARKEWEASILRSTDLNFHWVELKGLRQNLLPSSLNTVRRPLTASAKATVGNGVYVRAPAQGVTIWLAPELIDFEQRVAVHFNSRRERPDFVQPSVKTLLTRLRETGDRQRLYWARIDQ